MSPTTALVIDDDPLFRIVAEEALRAVGATKVLTAVDGAGGLRLAQEAHQTLDLIICDLQMPHLDGVSVIRDLGRIGYKGDLVIASGEKADILKSVRSIAQLAGIQVRGAIKKPMSADALRACLSQAGSAAPLAPVLIARHQLKTALAEGRITPFYQPKFDVKRRRATAAEALARVRDERGRHVSPLAYLQAADRENLTLEFTLAMFEHVIAHAKVWRAGGLDLELAINVSPDTLRDLSLPERLARRCKEAGLSPSRFTLEITENRLLEYHIDVLDVLSRLRLAGFQLSIDDFGTGATSIEQLKLYPFNELKIDQSFIRSAEADAFAQTTVETSARLAAMIGLTVVAEGVETESQMELAIKAGARFLQGYLIAKPMPADAVADWVADFHNKQGEAA